MSDVIIDSTPDAPEVTQRTIRVLLAGNPNSGKTTVFNALTGLKQKIGNFPGVTVERKSGKLRGPHNGGATYEIIDLPGLYSLVPRSLDEKITADILNGVSPYEQAPDIVVVVADATNLSRSLYLSTQIIDLGFPVILALNMMDLVDKQGLEIDVDGLSLRLGIPVIPMVAKKRDSVEALKQAIFQTKPGEPNARVSLTSSEPVELASICDPLVSWLRQFGQIRSDAGAFSEALRIVSNDEVAGKWRLRGDSESFDAALAQVKRDFDAGGIPHRQAEVRLRYAAIDQWCAQHVRRISKAPAISDKIDLVLTHRYFGPLIMLLILSAIFQSIYTWAELPMDAIEGLILSLGDGLKQVMPAGTLRDLLVEGVIAGVGAVLVFLPQIAFLFFFLAILEDTGYLTRVAFIMDRFMAKIGLSGQSVIPLLSSFACAIPGILATRTIYNTKDRLVTILVAPFMSCSARLPIYTLMIGAFIPGLWLGGIFYLPGLVLLSMYLLGIFAGVVSAFVLQKWVVKGRGTNFVMELPVYRIPVWRFVFLRMYEASKLFVINAGKIILAITIILWFLASYPKADTAATSPGSGSSVELAEEGDSDQIRQSFAGRLGRLIEPVIEPLGFDWKIGIGLITSFAAREVMVSTLATIYNIQDADETTVDLRTALKQDINPKTGKPVFTPLVAVSLMVFFVLACQCMSTLAVVRRETNSWRWPLFMFFYMLVFAYIGSFVVFQVGRLLGFA